MILKRKQFIPLHVHSAKGSVGDSILKIKDYVKRGKEYGLSHLALTEHGSMGSMYDFYEECKSNDIKPIIGLEAYEAIDRTVKSKKKDDSEKLYYHLILLAKNDIGLENLLYISTDASINGSYYKPRTDMSVLKEHGEGIIGLSACLGGRIPQALISITEDDLGTIRTNDCFLKAIEIVNEYKEVFDEFYLELQPGNFEQQIIYNKVLLELSEVTNTELVITNDIHYLDKGDHNIHNAHVKIARKQKLDDELIYPDTCYYFQDYNSISNSFPYLPKELVEKAIKQTTLISNKCNVNLSTDKLNMPHFDVPASHTESSYLTKLCIERLEEIKYDLEDPSQYMTRLLYELDVIEELGFSGYFLVVKDFVDYAKDNNIPIGPGRGSVCGSLVAFLANITEVNPVKYNLLFERFLSIHRKGTIPDIDLDFGSEKRHLMFEYAVEKYGIGRCALVSTLFMRKAKASLKDTARIYDIEKELADQAAKLIPEVYYDDEGEKTTDLSIEESLKIVPELKKMQKENPDWFSTAIKLEDLPRTTSIHAAGTLISPVDLIKHVPMIEPKQEGILATSLNLEDAEIAKMVKLDFLSLATLYVIDQTEKDVGYKFDCATDSYDEEEVWDLIGSKNTTCLFQIASNTYKQRMHRLKPRSIEELAACLALVRGPCISSKQDELYMQILEGTKEIELIHPFYDDVTKDTLGVLLYQEQLMQIAVNFGFSLEEGFKLMKTVSKKHIDKIMEFEERFRILADKNNVDKDSTDKIWNIMVDAGLYLFNKSHAIAYSMLSYKSAYLKAKYPKEYMTNALTNAYLRKENMAETAAECRRLGLKFLPLDVNKSEWRFTLEENKIRVGLSAIKGFGKKATETVLDNKPYKDFNDFNERIEGNKCTKRAIVPAIFAGMFSSFNEDRAALYNSYMEDRKEEPLDEIKLQGSKVFKVSDPYDKIEELILSAPLISSPVNSYMPIGFVNLKNKTTFTIRGIVKKAKKFRDKNKNMMAILELETADGYISVMVFANVYKDYKSYCKKDLIVELKARKEDEDTCFAIAFE